MKGESVLYGFKRQDKRGPTIEEVPNSIQKSGGTVFIHRLEHVRSAAEEIAKYGALYCHTPGRNDITVHGRTLNQSQWSSLLHEIKSQCERLRVELISFRSNLTTTGPQATLRFQGIPPAASR